MKRRNFYIGPGAASLLLVIVVVSMSVLGLLALISARSDERLMERSKSLIAAEYAANAAAERTLAEIDGILSACAQTAGDDEAYLKLMAKSLPEGAYLEGRIIRWTEYSGEGRALACAVEAAELGKSPRFTWREHMFLSDMDDALFE